MDGKEVKGVGPAVQIAGSESQTTKLYIQFWRYAIYNPPEITREPGPVTG